ncbi:MAG: serine hydrolase domain-containing protein [Promethearchaeota archaeon]
MKRVSYICFVLLVGTFLFTPVPPKTSSYAGEPDYWPTNAWQTSTPEEQGMDSKTLQEMDEFIDSSAWTTTVDSLLVVRNGCIVYERYRDETRQFYPHHIFSCTKVITSSLIGMCLEAGNLTLDDTVVDYFPTLTFQNMNSLKESITIKDLLTMSAGLEWEDNSDYYAMMAAENPVEYVLSRPMVTEPGQVWNYNTGCSHVLSYIIDNVSGIGIAALAELALFSPLGIDNYYWYEDSLSTQNGGTLLHLISRDMAKIGFLYLNNGTWNGAQIITKEYVAEATQSHIGFAFDYPYFDGYGYKWWIPKWNNSFGARGSNTQNILVIPDEDLIVVSTGSGDFPFEYLVDGYILPATSISPSSWIPWIIGGSSGVILTTIGLSVFSMRKRRKLPIE